MNIKGFLVCLIVFGLSGGGCAVSLRNNRQNGVESTPRFAFGTLGDLIMEQDWLPLEINIPDTISSMYQGLQSMWNSFFGGRKPASNHTPVKVSEKPITSNIVDTKLDAEEFAASASLKKYKMNLKKKRIKKTRRKFLRELWKIWME